MAKALDSLKIDQFENIDNSDFNNSEERKKLEQEIAALRQEGLGKEYPIVIDGEEIYTEEKLPSINPGLKSETIGYVSKTTQELAEQALIKSTEKFESWKKVHPRERAEYLFRTAELMQQRRHEFSALLILEAGKNFEEADAEVSEAIDFMNFYARSMIQLNEDDHQLKKIPNEDNVLQFVPLGVGFIVPPWNFPLAITAGLTVSAVVTGNTTVLKPAASTPVVAYKFFELISEAGLPQGVINFIPGDPKEFGDFITGHRLTRFISFTGSKEVGLRINEIAGRQAEGQVWLKRVNAEMGGKDGIVIDETADLDKAAQAIVASGFSFQGQKCSAGSRVIVVEEVHQALVDKVKALTEELSVGSGETNNDVGPVIDEKAYKNILNYIEIGKEEADLVIGGKPQYEESGYYIEPTIFDNVKPDARIMQEEIFGPVIAICKVKDWEEGIRIYNNTEYGLTGGFFSSDKERLNAAIERMYCGNLYLNRNITGALVGVHPFGGFNLSGTDSKAGSYDYLKIFSQGRLHTIVED